MPRFGVEILLSACLLAACAPTSAAEEPLTAAQVTRWADSRAYEAELVASLLKSGSARDLALAATGSQMLDVGSTIMGTGDQAPEDARELFRMAAAGAGDDVLVHWLIAANSRQDELVRRSVEALQQLEPGNGMAWLLALDSASRSKDEERIADALKHVSEADFYTMHLRENVVAWLDSTERFPPNRPLGSKAAPGETETDRRVGTALMFAYATDLPDVRGLMSECAHDRFSERPGRTELCLAIGRNMVSSSRDNVPRRLGLAVLRRLQVPDASEVARTIAWTKAAWDEAIAILTDNHRLSTVIEETWRQSRGEVEFEENISTRAGVPLAPPAGWEPPES